MWITSAAKVAYNVIVGFNSAKQLFFAIQDLYYDNLFRELSKEREDIKRRRRAITNAIETAKSNEDLQELSIVLAELERDAGLSDRREPGAGEAEPTTDGDSGAGS